MTATRTATEEKKDNENNKNGNAGAKWGKKSRVSIDGSVLKEKYGDNFNNTKYKYMYILSFFQNN